MKKIASEESMRCLVAADDVWEGQVVQTLRQTGMWVLVTTRLPEMAKPNERGVMNTLTDTKAEGVFRGAAELPPGERLCDNAIKGVRICGHVAMDVAFVGSWIRHVETESKQDAWARAVEEIKARGGGVDAERDDNRFAILQAGFEYLRAENLLAQKHAELTVFRAATLSSKNRTRRCFWVVERPRRSLHRSWRDGVFLKRMHQKGIVCATPTWTSRGASSRFGTKFAKQLPKGVRNTHLV